MCGLHNHCSDRWNEVGMTHKGRQVYNVRLKDIKMMSMHRVRAFVAAMEKYVRLST